MKRNIMPLIADALELKLDEEFEINVTIMGTPSHFRCKLTEFGLLSNRDGHWLNVEWLLEKIVCGDYEIKKLPFSPKLGEQYYRYSDITFKVVCSNWQGLPYEYALLKCGCVFRTKEEALKLRNQKYIELTGKVEMQ